ncbi:hypothetical protein M0E82_01875 [Corynebacterium sp. P7202]|uniref:Uncharacterized protein n=1 Tax=Corynebacterium pygosceleis TaxID=2800406 RepID=A0A9Q4GIW3_9CORY|nr:hypothetical protein [Corynebacterium pygosceleis]MCK7636756.1 hypothetical protein [Corynebacterium pygosceleis]MCX7467509.1 hypothetical protein [Corynebacterium pygosceleis]
MTAHLLTSATDVEELTADRVTSRLGLSAKFARREVPAAELPDRSL